MSESRTESIPLGGPDARPIFTDAFGAVVREPALVHAFGQACVSGLCFSRAERKVELFLDMPSPVSIETVEQLETALSGHFSIPTEVSQRVSRDVSGEAIAAEHGAVVLGYARRRQRHVSELLDGARLVFEDRHLKVQLEKPASAALNATGSSGQIESVVRSLFGRDVRVQFVDPESHAAVDYLKEKQEAEAREVARVMKEAQNPPAGAKPAQRPSSGASAGGSGSGGSGGGAGRGNVGGSGGYSGNGGNGGGQWQQARGNAGENGAPYRSRKKVTEEGAIVGRLVKGVVTPVREVTSDHGEVILQGTVQKNEIRELRSGKKLFTFEVSDGTSTVACKLFVDEEEQLEALKGGVKAGCGIRMRGEAQYDKFSQDLCVMARDIMPVKFEKRKDTAEVKRVELHLHTQMSSLDAISSTKSLLKQAADWGHRAVALTDHGVVQAFPDAQDLVNDLKKKDIPFKVLYGIEAYLLEEDILDEAGSILYKKTGTYHIILLVKNQTGLKNLYKLVSESHLQYLYKKPRVPRALLEKYREGLIIGSACEAGELFQALLKGEPEERLEAIAAGYDYLEIQPIGNNGFMLRNGQVADEEGLRDLNRRIVALGDRIGKPVCATCDVHFQDPDDAMFRAILQAGQGYTDADRQAPLYFRTTEEMLAEFDYLGYEKAYEVVVTNTNLVADWIDVVQPIPKGTFPPHLDGAEEDIRRMSEERVAELYSAELPTLVRARVERELGSIIKNGFSVMYMIAQKLVKKSLDDGYLVGSRGSVGSSFVAYLIGITEVNSLPAHYRCGKCFYAEFHEMDKTIGCGFDLPEKTCPKCGEPLIKDGYDIPFETFLGFDGDKEPDIDLNFSGEYQPRAHKYTEELFGEGYVFRAGTIATIADKTAYGFVKRFCEERSRILPRPEMERLARGCTGIKRTTGQHPGGVMVVPHDKEIYDFSPIQRPADDAGSDIITTHFDYHSISGRILKLDILGHDDPTVIRMLEDLTGLNAQEVPIGEKRTMSIFSSTEALGVTPDMIGSDVGTFGVPEFGTKFVRQMLLDTMPSTFAELIRISGLSHGTDVWLNNAQELVRAGTTGLADVISTRDDIMIYLIKNGLPPLTAFKIMESVRKGKGLAPDQEELMRGCGVPEWYIGSCKKIKYMFPKAHAAAYVMMAFRIAWFKVYHPKAFYTTYFSVRADAFDADIVANGPPAIANAMRDIEDKGKEASQKEQDLYTILEVAREMYARGIKCLKVDLFKSDATHFQMADEGILPPFTALQGLGASAAKNIAAARDEGEFLSVEELKIRAGVSKAVIDIMTKHGCLDGMDASSQISLFG